MATTTNYGWTTPDDTGLVKDGASAIRTLGSSVDTTVKNLNPETTLGDISYRSATANTNTRLAIGTTGQVLTVNGGVPAWVSPAGGAGNLVQIATGTLSGASVTVSGLSSYTNLYVGLYQARAASSGRIFTRINNNSTSANYPGWWWYWYSSGGTGSSGAIQDSQPGIPLDYADSHSGGNTNNIQWLDLTDCKNPGFTAWSSTSYYHGANYATRVIENGGGVYKVSEAVSSLVFVNDGGNWTGGTYFVFGA